MTSRPGPRLRKPPPACKDDGPSAAALAQNLQDADRTLDQARHDLITRIAANQDASAETRALDRARASRATRISNLARTCPDYAAFADPHPLDLASAAALLHPDEVLIHFASADPPAAGVNATGHIFAVTRTGY